MKPGPGGDLDTPRAEPPTAYKAVGGRRIDSGKGDTHDDLQAEADRLAEKHIQACRRCDVPFVRGTGSEVA